MLTVDVEDGADHTLSIAVDGGNATVMMASTPLPVSQWLERLSSRAASLENEQQRSTAQTAIETAKAALADLDPKADRTAQQAQGARASASGKQVDDTPVDQAQARLETALEAVFKALGGGSSAITDIFETQLKAAHPEAQEDIRAALEANPRQFQSLSWDQVQNKLHDSKIIAIFKPLLKRHAFGLAAQKEITDIIRESPDGSKFTKSTLDNFMRNRLVRFVNAETVDVYTAAKRELNETQFKQSKIPGPKVEAAIRAALDTDGVTPDLAQHVGATTVVPFLIHMGSKPPEEQWKKTGIKPENFQGFWSRTPDKNHIKSAFRSASPGDHEWLPTGYVANVVARAQEARASKAAGEAGTAASWIKFQHAFRNPTKIVIFPPKDPYLREVPFTRDPVSHATLKTSSVTVLQGHPGAVYAPAKDGGYRSKSPEVAQQVKGHNGWNSRLELSFEKNAAKNTSEAGMRGIIKDVENFVEDNVWNGKTSPSPVFREYYEAARPKADGLTTKHSILTSRARTAHGEIAEAVTRAKTAAGLKG